MIKDETLKHPLQIVTLNGDCRWQVKNDLLGRINFNYLSSALKLALYLTYSKAHG